MTSSIKKHVFLWALLFVMPVLSACESLVYEEGRLSPNRVQVQEEKFVEEVPVEHVNESYIRALGESYERYGDGEVNLTVTYDPKSSSNTAMKASNKLSSLVKSFRMQGMTNLNANIVPVRDQGSESIAIVSFTSFSAHAPKDCNTMAGYDDTKIDIDPDYKMGCTLDTVLARQISRPKDLKGQSLRDSKPDARRSSVKVEPYRAGVNNAPLDGESASE